MAVLSGGPDNMPEDMYDGLGIWVPTLGSEWSAWRAFNQRTRLIVITAKDAGCRFQISEDGSTPSESIQIFTDTTIALSLQARYWRGMNLVGAEDCSIIVNSFYQKPQE